jgi:multicomponent Na+:H+ antiporter subunit G
MIIIGIILLLLAWMMIIFGVISIFSYANLYARIVASTVIDTVASILLILALIFFLPNIQFSFRLVLLLIFLLVTSPISTHVNIRSAYLSKLPLDHHLKDQKK